MIIWQKYWIQFYQDCMTPQIDKTCETKFYKDFIYGNKTMKGNSYNSQWEDFKWCDDALDAQWDDVKIFCRVL